MDEIQKLIEHLKNGNIGILPTDTVIGISGDALISNVHNKIRKLKGRPISKQFILLFRNLMQVESYVGMLTEREKTIIKKESDRPTTFIIENKKQIISDDPTLGIRIPKKGMITEVLKQYPHPIISTSVNISGEPSIEKIEDIPNSIKENVDFILNLHPQNSDGRPSRIIDLLETGIRVIRE